MKRNIQIAVLHFMVISGLLCIAAIDANSQQIKTPSGQFSFETSRELIFSYTISWEIKTCDDGVTYFLSEVTQGPDVKGYRLATGDFVSVSQIGQNYIQNHLKWNHVADNFRIVVKHNPPIYRPYPRKNGVVSIDSRRSCNSEGKYLIRDFSNEPDAIISVEERKRRLEGQSIVDASYWGNRKKVASVIVSEQFYERVKALASGTGGTSSTSNLSNTSNAVNAGMVSSVNPQGNTSTSPAYGSASSAGPASSSAQTTRQESQQEYRQWESDYQRRMNSMLDQMNQQIAFEKQIKKQREQEMEQATTELANMILAIQEQNRREEMRRKRNSIVRELENAMRNQISLFNSEISAYKQTIADLDRLLINYGSQLSEEQRISVTNIMDSLFESAKDVSKNRNYFASHYDNQTLRRAIERRMESDYGTRGKDIENSRYSFKETAKYKRGTEFDYKFKTALDAFSRRFMPKAPEKATSELAQIASSLDSRRPDISRQYGYYTRFIPSGERGLVSEIERSWKVDHIKLYVNSYPNGQLRSKLKNSIYQEADRQKSSKLMETYKYFVPKSEHEKIDQKISSFENVEAHRALAAKKRQLLNSSEYYRLEASKQNGLGILTTVGILGSGAAAWWGFKNISEIKSKELDGSIRTIGDDIPDAKYSSVAYAGVVLGSCIFLFQNPIKFFVKGSKLKKRSERLKNRSKSITLESITEISIKPKIDYFYDTSLFGAVLSIKF